jgi:hypothetical protein
MAKKTFDFGDTPVNQFISLPSVPSISTPAVIQTDSRPQKIGSGKKDKRICVMIQSTLFEDIAKIARVKGISKNEAFCRAAREYRDNERRDLERYKVLFEELDGIKSGT